MRTNQAFMFIPHYAMQIPGTDLADKFGRFSSIGLGIDYKFKNNVIIGLDYDWYFGNNVVDNGRFSNITGPSGVIIDANGDFSVIRLDVRGNYGTVNLGYLWSPNKKETFSGILVMGGAGVMRHKVDLFSSQITIPQVNDDYEYGYDQMAYGLATKQYIGYQRFVSKSRYRLRIGAEFNQGFTQGRRTWDFNANKSGLDKRFDTTIAFKIGFIVPVYTKYADDEEFFTD